MFGLYKVHRLRHGEDASRRNFFSMYSTHVAKMEGEIPQDLGLAFHANTDLMAMSKTVEIDQADRGKRSEALAAAIPIENATAAVS